ncbi:MAG: hypothetical protein Q8K78_13685 [Planctomycetaceae bacterium]|nr:hypothetical protein [Planctomycetaceae bacterium]
MRRFEFFRWASLGLICAATPQLMSADELVPSPAPLPSAVVGEEPRDPQQVFTDAQKPEIEQVSASTWATPVAPPPSMASLGGCCGESDTGLLGLGGGLLGFIKPSDTCFSNFISPISNPLFFEDPRTLSEVRLIFANHWLPQNNPVFQGGQAQYLAMQARVALTERLSFIATKDGYVWIDPDNPAVGNPDGWADVAAGLKYNLVRDPANQHVLSVGATFELDVGSHRVFQGRGDGEFHFFATNGVALTEKSHWLTASGFRLPTDTAARSQMWYWSNHYDYNIWGKWYAVGELNWFHYMQSGKALGVNFEGGDLFNLGATDVAGNDLVTMAVGARRKLWGMSELGIGYELPVTARQDIISSRLYLDLILRY